MTYEAINFNKKFNLFHDQWQPKVIAEMNDYQFKVVRLQGDFIWHDQRARRLSDVCIILTTNFVALEDGHVGTFESSTRYARSSLK
jgi:hypothetical protein